MSVSLIPNRTEPISAVNRLDARTALAPTASRGGAAVRAIGLGMTTITMTTTTPPAGTG